MVRELHPRSTDNRPTPPALHDHSAQKTPHTLWRIVPLRERERARAALPPAEHDHCTHDVAMRERASAVLAARDGYIVCVRVVVHELHDSAGWRGLGGIW